MERPTDKTGMTRCLLLAGCCLLVLASACSRGPRVEDPGIARKMDLRLRLALGGQSEDPGAWIRVAVRLKSDPLPEDRPMLARYGHVGALLGPIATLTIRPERLIPLAREKRVSFIELESFNVPNPEPPPAVKDRR
jgi:hypothetical protein